MPLETVHITVEEEDRTELDRLVARHGGDYSAFLQEAIKVMADRERAERRVIGAPD